MNVYDVRRLLDECDGEAEFLIAVKGVNGLNVYEVNEENISFQPALELKEDFTMPLAVLVGDENLR